MQEKLEKAIAKKLLGTNPRTKAELNSFKHKIAKECGIAYPTNIALLAALKQLGRDPVSVNSKQQRPGLCRLVRLMGLLRLRPVRSLSGVVNVSVMTKPYPCPGKCLYCPNEPGLPKSYLSGEPAVERAKRLKFDPFWQVFKRLEILASEGHPIDKVELRIIGGTWSAYPKAYRENFVRRCFFAANCIGKTRKRKIGSFSTEQRLNESAKSRLVSLSVETRPDFIDEKEIKHLRTLGLTKVELGVQSIYDDVLRKNVRGHNVADTIRATKLLKNAGFKVSYQIMFNLFGSTPKRDVKMIKQLFENEDFQPDLLKIYPCVVLPEAPLHKLFRQKKYKPYPQRQLVSAIIKAKTFVPPYVRIERVIRDIPSPRAVKHTGVASNLRQTVLSAMAAKGLKCRCIRCREIKEMCGIKEKIFFVRRDYPASGGREVFLSVESRDKSRIFSLLRLRIPQNSNPVLPVLKNAALIRELHTYGPQMPIAQRGKAAQHRGLGKKLVLQAETIAKKEFGMGRIAAIAGVGSRAYWRKLDYKLTDTYMVKKFAV